MIDVCEYFGLEVDDINFAMRHIQHNNLSVTHLPKDVDHIVIFFLVEYFALLVEMDYAFGLTGYVLSYHDKGVVVGS